MGFSIKWGMWVLLLGAGTALCGQSLRVGVAVLPLESLVREIGGDAVEVRSLQQEGDSCSTFEPRPSAISWLASAELFFRIGVGYESVILPKLQSQFADLRVLDLRDTVELLPYADHHDPHHVHSEACAHGVETDPHVWLDPVRLAAMAGFVADRLAEARPGQADAFRLRAEEFQSRILDLHRRIAAELEPFTGRSFYIYHPALNYFATRYGLLQVSLSGPASPPTARELHRLVGQARAGGVRTIFVQPQESHRHAAVVADAIGAQLVEIDPMARDCDTNLVRIAQALAGAFAKE